MNVRPHVAQNTSGRRSAIDKRTTRHPGYAASQRIRKRIEEAFGWIKGVGGLRQTRLRGLAKVDWAFTFAAAACNLVRVPKLIGQQHDQARAGLRLRLRRGWRITEMDEWDEIDLLGSAHIMFSGKDGGPASGRGWAALGTAGRLVGHIFIHKGDDSGFVAERE